MYETAYATETFNDNFGSEPSFEGFDPNFDPTAPPAPMPDGTYNARAIIVSELEEVDAWKKGAKGYSRKLSIEVTGPDYIGRRLTTYISTAINKQGSSSAAQFVFATGNGAKLLQVRNHTDLTALVDAILSEGPEFGIRTRWEASEKLPEGGYLTLARGQKAFPQRANGTYDHTGIQPTQGGTVYVDARIASFARPRK